MDNDDWSQDTVTLDEACRILGVSTATLHRWESEGAVTLSKSPLINKRVRYRRAEVEELASKINVAEGDAWDTQYVSEFLDLPARTVLRLETSGKLNPVRTIGNHRRYSPTEVTEYRDSADYRAVKARQRVNVETDDPDDDLSNPEGDPDGFIYAETAAAMLGVQRGTLRKWEREGKLVAHPKRRNHRVIYTRGTIAEFKKQRERA